VRAGAPDFGSTLAHREADIHARARGPITFAVRRRAGLPTSLAPGFALAGAITILVSMSLLGSVFLSATANGIAMFMLYGAGLVSGLLATIGATLNAHTVQTIAHAMAIALPFEGLYQAALHALGSNQTGLSKVLVNLGPFGSSHAGSIALYLWAVLYLATLALLATVGFARRDL